MKQGSFAAEERLIEVEVDSGTAGPSTVMRLDFQCLTNSYNVEQRPTCAHAPPR